MYISLPPYFPSYLIASGPSVDSLFSFDFSSQLKFAAKYSNALREFSWNPFAAPPRLDMEISRTSCGYTVTSIPYYCLLIFLFWFSRSTLLTQATDRADACKALLSRLGASPFLHGQCHVATITPFVCLFRLFLFLSFLQPVTDEYQCLLSYKRALNVQCRMSYANHIS